MSASNLQLSNFLESQRRRYLEDVVTGKGSGWTVVMGNEAGDLDSAASSIGYAYLQAKSEGSNTSNIVPLIRTSRVDIRLRPENVHAFKQASLRSNWEDLLCLDDIHPSSFPSNKFVLVDHNRLSDQFDSPDDESRVVGILDHHEDEGLYLGANPRWIQVPVGSCASLVVEHFRKQGNKAWIPELAGLLLSAIAVDTNGLKSGGKTTKIDKDAARFLIPFMTNSAAKSLKSGNESEELQEVLNGLTTDLLSQKGDVSHLSNRDLLRRDYKEFRYTSTSTSTSTTSPLVFSSISVGLSTVPIDLKEWVPLDPQAILEWMKERKLMIHGSLTSFRREADKKKGKRGKHKRQQLWVIRQDIPDELEKTFWRVLEDDRNLECEKMKGFKGKLGLGTMTESSKVRVRAYKQGNVHATRKNVAPLVKQIVQGYLTSNS